MSTKNEIKVLAFDKIMSDDRNGLGNDYDKTAHYKLVQKNKVDNYLGYTICAHSLIENNEEFVLIKKGKK